MPVIRHATDADCERIAQIHVRGWQTTYAGHMPDDYLASLSVAERAEGWRKWLSADHFAAIVYLEENEILGYAAWSTRSEAAELVGLYIDPDHKRRGIGSRLMTQFESETDDRAGRALWILSGNEPARSFYLSFGYRESGETREADVGGVIVHETRLKKRG